MDPGGWIKLHRSLARHPRAQDPDWVATWIHLLLHATHAPCPALFRGQIITLQPGQLVTGRRRIARITGVNESKIKRLLKVMKSEQQIDQQASNTSSLITITNWPTYQESDQQNDQQVTNERPTSDQRVTTVQEVQEGKKGRETRARAREVGGLGGDVVRPSLEEVVTWGEMHNVPREICEAYWQARDETGWKRHGDPVERFQSGLMRFATNWRAFEAGKKKPAEARGEQDLEAELAQETDPQRRAELRAKLRGQ